MQEKFVGQHQAWSEIWESVVQHRREVDRVKSVWPEVVRGAKGLRIKKDYDTIFE